MSYMFYYNSAFNQDIGNWNVAQVTFCYRFDYEATSWIDDYKPNFTQCSH